MSWEVNNGVKFALGIIGNITALGLFLAPLKTMWAIVQARSTESYSVVPYVTALLNCLLWTFYGMPFIGEGRILVITVNAAGAVLEACYVFICFLFNSTKQRIRTMLYTGAILLFFGAVAAITLAAFATSSSRSLFLGVINDVVTIAMYASPLEIMLVVYRTKSVKYMPFYLSLLSFLNGLAWTAYAVYVSDVFITIPNAVGAVLGAIQLILYALYHHVEVTMSRRMMLSESQKKMTPDFESGRDTGSNDNGFPAGEASREGSETTLMKTEE